MPQINIPNIDGLAFEATEKSWNAMSPDEFKRFIDVWLDAGEGLARSSEIATQRSKQTNGEESADWGNKAAKAEVELSRWRKMMKDLRSGDAVIAPPKDATVNTVDTLVKGVAVLQSAEGMFAAKLKAVNAVFSVAQQVLTAHSPSP